MSELIRNFGIDWKLLAAQAVNFFILLFLLKKFAYGPILTALRERKKRIEEGIHFAREAEEKLVQSEKARKAALANAEKEALRMIAASEETAKKRGEEIVVASQKKVETVVQDAKRLIEEEKAKMHEAVLDDARQLVRLGIEKVLGGMPAEERDRVLIDEALRELKAAHQ